MTILVVGAGSIGTRHIRNLLRLGCSVSIFDRDASCRVPFEKMKRVTVYDNLKMALASGPTACFVCTPTRLHLSVARRALRAGAHVFIEKPLSHSLAGTSAFIREAAASKRVVMVACNYLFHDGMRALQKVIRQNAYGAALVSHVALGYHLPSARALRDHRQTYASQKGQGGDVLLDSGSHVLVYLCALFGSCRKVAAFSSSLHPLGLGSKEAAVLAVTHKSGVLSTVSLDYASSKATHRIEVVTEKGRLVLDLRKNKLTFEDERASKTLYQGTRDLNHMFLKEIRHFLRCVRSGEQPLQDVTLGRDIVKLLCISS